MKYFCDPFSRFLDSVQLHGSVEKHRVCDLEASGSSINETTRFFMGVSSGKALPEPKPNTGKTRKRLRYASCSLMAETMIKAE